MLVQFQKNNIINKKIIVIAIWIFALLVVANLLAVTYEELISERLTRSNSIVNLETLAGVALGIILIGGLLLESKIARRGVLLFAYISLLSPFILYIMLKIFMPESDEDFWTLFIFPNILMSLAIIYLLTNNIALKLYSVRKRRRIKEQIYLIALAVFLIGIYVYYIYIPLQVTPDMIPTSVEEMVLFGNQ
jgi:hypothetical protein